MLYPLNLVKALGNGAINDHTLVLTGPIFTKRLRIMQLIILIHHTGLNAGFEP